MGGRAPGALISSFRTARGDDVALRVVGDAAVMMQVFDNEVHSLGIRLDLLDVILLGDAVVKLLHWAMGDEVDVDLHQMRREEIADHLRDRVEQLRAKTTGTGTRVGVDNKTAAAGP